MRLGWYVETFSRRAVIDADFETTVGNLCRALRETGMDVIARVDVRDHVWRQGCNMCRYVLLEAWSPDQAIAALRDSPDLGALLMTTLAIYELAPTKTVVTTREALAPLADDPGWRHGELWLAAHADRERGRIADALDRLLRSASTDAATTSAA